MIPYKKRHFKKNFKLKSQNDFLINIDYLIVNLEGQPFGDFPDNSNFHLKHFDYGTKIFQNRSELYYNNLKIGVFTSKPRSSIISQDFAQLQFENNLFYTHTLDKLKTILSDFCHETTYAFRSINRLDIALDKNDIDNSYRELYNNVMNGNYLISGRPKNIQSYFDTYKGKSVLNGFSLGKRSSDKLIRVYNKTLSLQLTEKPYINDFYKNNGLKNENVWRFEFQLNSSFFRNLKQISPLGIGSIQDSNWCVFDFSALFEFLKIATKGFFEIHVNTGKSQINKESKIQIFDFDAIRLNYTTKTIKLKKYKSLPLSNQTIKKRLAKSLFREYYSNNQDISYIIALNLLLEEQDILTEQKLLLWFHHKINFYLTEFKHKEKIIQQFDKELFTEHQTLFL